MGVVGVVAVSVTLLLLWCCTGSVLATLFLMVLVSALWEMVSSWIQGPNCQSSARLDGRLAVVTGANTGIGRSVINIFVIFINKVIFCYLCQVRCQGPGC